MSRKPCQIDRARELRRAMTPAESVLWKYLRGRRFEGHKFRRQHPIGPFYADFVCLECRLVVELDGETHLGNERADEARNRYLEDSGFLTLRYWNNQMYDETEAVLESIYQTCLTRIPKGETRQRNADS